eukprot:EG_transcript_52027
MLFWMFSKGPKVKGLSHHTTKYLEFKPNPKYPHVSTAPPIHGFIKCPSGGNFPEPIHPLSSFFFIKVDPKMEQKTSKHFHLPPHPIRLEKKNPLDKDAEAQAASLKCC